MHSFGYCCSHWRSAIAMLVDCVWQWYFVELENRKNGSICCLLFFSFYRPNAHMHFSYVKTMVVWNPFHERNWIYAYNDGKHFSHDKFYWFSKWHSLWSPQRRPSVIMYVSSTSRTNHFKKMKKKTEKLCYIWPEHSISFV